MKLLTASLINDMRQNIQSQGADQVMNHSIANMTRLLEGEFGQLNTQQMLVIAGAIAAMQAQEPVIVYH